MSSTSNWIIIGAVALLLAIGAWYVASSGSGTAPLPTNAGATAPAADAPATTAPDATAPATDAAPAADAPAADAPAADTAPAAGN
jgi:hypothetical protein